MANTVHASPEAADEAQLSNFLKTTMIVLGFLVVFTLFCALMARMLASSGQAGNDDSIVRASLMERITPVGAVRTSPDAATESTMVASAPQSGPEIVESVCAGCHIAGVANAPKLDDTAAWEERRSAGLDTLVASVINGKGAMPARAGTSLSDEELRLAVQHMAGFEVDSAAPADDSAAASSGGDSDAASTEATESTAQPVKADDAPAAAGFVAAELTDRVKGIVDSVCIACHLAGVAGAPKLGDTAAWDERAEKGLEAQVAVVSTGKGAMPARGGSDLSDEELGAAIEYMMTK